MKPTILVAGLGRCGSSLVMQMLDAAGVPCIGTWPDFEDEAYSAGRLRRGDLARVGERALKLLDPHRTPAASYDYVKAAVIFLTRDPKQQAESMLKLVGAPINRGAIRAMGSRLPRDEAASKDALLRFLRPSSARLDIAFEFLIERPSDAATFIAHFLDADGWAGLSPERMAACVRPRSPDCFDGLLEFDLMSNGGA